MKIKLFGGITMEKRNYGIDLLRIVLMFMVCILHTLGQGGILSASTKGSIGYNTFWFLEILSLCAVDSFAIISGYTAKDKPLKYDKLVNIWFQVFFYSFIITIILTIIGINKNYSLLEIISTLFPITFKNFWYMTAYFILFFSIPILNSFIFKIDKKASEKAFIIIFALFSFIGILGDPFHTLNGYSPIWLIALYCLGSLANKIKLFENKKSITLILLWAICIIITWIVHIYLGIDILIKYTSPTILLSGLIMVILFSRINLKGNIISKLSPLALGIYLFHQSPVIWNNIIKDSFTFVVDKNIFIGILLVFTISSIIFISGLLVEFIRSKIANLINLPSLSKKIVLLIDKILNKTSIILK